MARPREPLTVGGEEIVLDAPGLKFIKRGTEKRPHWVRNSLAKSRGFQPATVQLHFDYSTREGAEKMAEYCRSLQAEMLEWLGDPQKRERIVFDGTLDSLIRLYQKHDDSPYHALRENGRRSYDDWCAALSRMCGKRILAKLTGQDFLNWYRNIRRPPGWKGPPRDRLAEACMQTMLKVLLDFGIVCDLKPCFRLSTILEKTTFRAPKEAGAVIARKKKVAMTFEQASELVDEALRRLKDKPAHLRWRSMALGIAAQFEFNLRQIDVIGEWERIRNKIEIPAGSFVAGGKIWRAGLLFSHLSLGEFGVAMSKNAIGAEYDIANAQLVLRALDAVPAADRAGPLVVGDRKLPVKRRYYADLFRELADACGLPTEVCNMHLRHSGATETYNAIAEANDGQVTEAHLSDLAFVAGHADIETTRRNYVDPGTGPSRRTGAARVALREKVTRARKING